MPIATDTVLKTYFNTNDSPTEKQMINLVDSIKHFNDESQIAVYHPSPGSTDIIPLFVADRAVTITYFAMTSKAAGTMSCNLKKNSGGSLSNLTGTASTVHNFTSASSFPTETITTSAVADGDAVYVDMSAYTSGDQVTFVVRYI